MEYELKRTRRKTLSVEITRDCRVVVRSPLRLPLREIESFLADRVDWIDTHLKRQQERLAAHPEPDPAELEELTRLAKDYIPGRVSHFAAIMGLAPAGVGITAAKTRFGSCSAKNRLCFSCRLMGYPPEAIDYVVVHELAHITHKNHGPAFYALVASVLPDYAKRRALLRR